MERTRRIPIVSARGVGAIREASQLCELVHAIVWRCSCSFRMRWRMFVSTCAARA